ncbi:helix-turn-helix domain-containing protein [Flavobacterium sp. WC2509]|uniref:helix-turn-helix domain-containing protein n=1 Tax=Flavobacterium sp. WC2509 TaxID=3461406 RepID=UPI0040445D03
MLKSNRIGDKITDARKKINISQAQLAERLFISPQAVGKWERGESMPDIITLDRLAEILGVDLNYFSENFQSIAITATANAPLIAPSAGLPSEKQQDKLRWDMSRSNLADIDFSGLKNLHEKFSSSNIQRCKFVGSDLSGLLLKSNNVDSCDFSSSDISGSHIQRSNIDKNLFKNCSLKETEFSESNIGDCDFSNTDFTGASFKSSNFEKNTINNAIWNRTSFIGIKFDDTVFNGILKDCYFENCGFYRVTFQNATLINTFFKNNSRWKRVVFIDCKVDQMTYAFLKNEKADLSGLTLLTE